MRSSADAASGKSDPLTVVGGPLPVLRGCLLPMTALPQVDGGSRCLLHGQMDAMLAMPGFVAGTTNQLMISHAGLADVVVNLGSAAPRRCSPRRHTPSILFRSTQLRNLLDLTTPDLRFSDAILQTVYQTAVVRFSLLNIQL